MLTTRQRVFTDEVLRGELPEEALRRAGYREENAAETARRLLRSATVQEYMKRKAEEDSRRTDGRSDKLLLFLSVAIRGEHSTERERLRAAELLDKRQGVITD